MKTIDMKIKQQCDRNSLQESVAGRQDNRAGHFSGEQSSTHYHLILSLCLTIALLAMPANAVVNVLVGSTESHSIEKFSNSGVWMKTFASTGPWTPFGIAVSPVTHDVFAATNTGPTSNIILRYNSSGAPLGAGGNLWSTFDVYPYLANNSVLSIVFDASGNLYVASNIGTGGYQVVILTFPAAQLLRRAPVPNPAPIITTAGRGDQMAFDVSGNICIASFAAPNTVQCYNPTSGALTHDYALEIQSAGIQPVGLYFGPKNNLTVSSVFTGQVWVEAVAQVGPMNLLASGMINDVGFLTVDSSGMLYLPSFHNPEGRYLGCSYYSCVDYDTSSDIVYKIDPSSGAVTTFISSHLWGPYQMIFVPF